MTEYEDLPTDALKTIYRERSWYMWQQLGEANSLMRPSDPDNTNYKNVADLITFWWKFNAYQILALIGETGY